MYAYDGNGYLTALTPPGRPAHGFAYTPVNLESEYAPPQPQPLIPDPRTLFTYNLDRQLDLITRPDGFTVDFVYDSAGRLSAQLLPAGQGQVSYTYDPVTGILTTITGPSGETLTLTSDGSLLLSETWSGAVSGSVSRTYDDDFRVGTQSVNAAQTVSFSYDPDSLLTGAGSLAVTRDPQNGLLTGATLGVVADSYGYNGFGEVTSYTAEASGTPLYDAQYSRDALGRITEKTETIAGVTDTFTYSYDAAGRLTDVLTNGLPTAHYDHDANSNRVAGFNGAGSISASYDDQDRLLTYGTASYTHTANGEWLAKTDSSGTTTYSYDVLGNLTAVTLPNGTSIEYVIDGRNRRVGKRVNGSLAQGWLYDGQLRLVAELDGSNQVVSRFVYGGRSNVPEYMIKGGATYRLIPDQLGSPRLIVNIGDGTVAQRIDYDEFGNVLTDTNSGFQPFGFASGLYDPDTRLVRFGARDYDPETGRWTAKDPIRFNGGDTNLYGYLLGDPVNGVDVRGQQATPSPAPGSSGWNPACPVCGLVGGFCGTVCGTGDIPRCIACNLLLAPICLACNPPPLPEPTPPPSPAPSPGCTR